MYKAATMTSTLKERMFPFVKTTVRSYQCKKQALREGGWERP
jgi:hypothetical protein